MSYLTYYFILQNQIKNEWKQGGHVILDAMHNQMVDIRSIDTFATTQSGFPTECYLLEISKSTVKLRDPHGVLEPEVQTTCKFFDNPKCHTKREKTTNQHKVAMIETDRQTWRRSTPILIPPIWIYTHFNLKSTHSSYHSLIYQHQMVPLKIHILHYVVESSVKNPHAFKG